MQSYRQFLDRPRHRHTLSTRDRHVDAVAIQNKTQPSRAILTLAGAKGEYADGSLLPLEFIHASDASARRKRRLQAANLCIVRRDEQKIV